MHAKQECEDHATWQKHLNIACWVTLVVGFFLVIFTNRELAGLLIIAISMILFILGIVLDIRHTQWHIKQGVAEDEEDS